MPLQKLPVCKSALADDTGSDASGRVCPHPSAHKSHGCGNGAVRPALLPPAPRLALHIQWVCWPRIVEGQRITAFRHGNYLIHYEAHRMRSAFARPLVHHHAEAVIDRLTAYMARVSDRTPPGAYRVAPTAVCASWVS